MIFIESSPSVITIEPCGVVVTIDDVSLSLPLLPSPVTTEVFGVVTGDVPLSPSTPPAVESPVVTDVFGVVTAEVSLSPSTVDPSVTTEVIGVVVTAEVPLSPSTVDPSVNNDGASVAAAPISSVIMDGPPLVILIVNC